MKGRIIISILSLAVANCFAQSPKDINKYNLPISYTEAEAKSVITVENINIDQFKPKAIIKLKGDNRLIKFKKAISEHQNNKPEHWEKLVEKVKEQTSDFDKLAMATLIVNQIPYVDGTDGSYMAPDTALKRGGGVCKEYAVMKYLLLKDAGFQTDKLALMVHDTSRPGIPMMHVVLVAMLGKSIYISNQYGKVTAENFYRSQNIKQSEFSKDIQKNGIDALHVDFSVKSTWAQRSITLVSNYINRSKELYEVINENGRFKITNNIKVETKLRMNSKLLAKL